MNKQEIQKEYNKKIKLFNKYNKYYYDNSSPIVSDREFDALKQNILLLEKKYKIIKKSKIKKKKTLNKIKSLFDWDE